MSRPATEANHQQGAPARDDSSGPDSPTDLTRASWVYVARKTMREFSRDQCTDLAVALTYTAVLALFPTAIALLSLVSVFGQGPSTVDFLAPHRVRRGPVIGSNNAATHAGNAEPDPRGGPCPGPRPAGGCGRHQGTSGRSGVR